MKTRIEPIDRNEVTYWVGLALLFVGLAIHVSAATALIVIGAVIIVESIITSYLATWLSLRDQPAVKKEN